GAGGGPAVVGQGLEPDPLVADADQLAPLPVGGDVADLEGAAPAPDLLEQLPEVVARVETAVDQVDPDALPGQRLANGLEIGEHGGLVVQQTALLVPHRLQ